MKKIFAVFLLSILIIFLSNCSLISDKYLKQISVDNGKKIIKVDVEIADNEEEWARGLMFREKLYENEGMLFVFEEEENLTFWMKNTLIPLDIIFIDENFEIVDIKHAVPCKEGPCETYISSSPAKFVLEVNMNFTIMNNIKLGDKIIMNQ